MACHYLEDLNAPHHAINAFEPFGFHRDYESWVNNQWQYFSTPTMTYDSYRFMYNKSPKEIADNFAGLAKASYKVCSEFTDSEYYAQVATMSNIYRTERDIAGFLNAYYYKGGLNS